MTAIAGADTGNHCLLVNRGQNRRQAGLAMGLAAVLDQIGVVIETAFV
jgi:hypothetical protein